MYHVGVDIGGTFTDCAVLDGDGAIATIAKSPSSRRDPAEGVLGALAVAAENLGQPLDAFLADSALLLHGCTVATNAVVERSGVRTGLITTKGHEDALFIGKVIQKVAGLSEREMLHQSRLAKADPPIVERRLVIGVPERLDAHGQVVVPLDLAAAEAALDALVAAGVQAVAVSFLWAFLDPRHEQAVGALARRKYPALYVALSSEVAPVLGEYERTATAALSAYLGPPVLGYLERLAGALRERGYGRELLLSHCMGGLTTVAEARIRPLLTLDSGPAGGVLGARYFGRLYGEPNVLCTDMGGTTFDVSLVRGGAAELDEEPVVDKYHVLVPKIAIHSIGAGGGSILWVDPDGLLHVGPQSAGAEPGPACYGEGGVEPTITDADLLLGYLNPDRFLGGRKRLDRALAEQAVGRVAARLGMDPIATAAGAFRIVNAQMADLIRQVTVEQGHDPRAFALFAYGGAGPAHAAFYGRDLGVRRLYVPSFSTVFSALGMLTGGRVHSAEASYPAVLPLDAAERAGAETLYAALERRLLEQFAAEGVGREAVCLQRYAYVKYRLQPRALAVPLPPGPLTAAQAEALAADFEAAYAEVYGAQAGFRQAGLELLKCRVDGTCPTVAPRLAARPPAASADPAAARVGARPAYFAEAAGFVDTPVYDGARLEPGHVLAGPCIVERMGDTIVLPPGASGHVDQYENLLLEL